MDNRSALDPHRSVVVEACAGSGKTWLLVSRVVRLLLDGVSPGEILAITFTRKAAQEMQARLRDWLYDLASKEDEFVREFLRQRGVADVESALPRARLLYQQLLLAKPSITISTFHGWFMQILQRAPLSSGSAGGVQLVEKTAELWAEAWQTFLDELHRHPDSETAQSMMFLFKEIGLSNTQSLLRNFAGKRSEWWAYTAGQREGAVAFALQNLREEFDVDMECDPVADLFDQTHFADDVHALSRLLNASAAQLAKAARMLMPLDGVLHTSQRFELLWEELFTKKDEPRSIKANKGQDGVQLDQAVERVREPLQTVRNRLQTQQLYQHNVHALRCGAALLDTYQELKKRQQVLDFGDLEWRVCQLLGESDHAEYLQYKLDSRYRHVLLDEFQDTNPLQWQILQSWFAASAAVDRAPVVFVVGDPKQSIYRFRRADARLFDVVRRFLQEHYHALHLKKNETRRNAPAVLSVVNGVFDGLPEYQGFERHHSHQQSLPGYVEVLPLSEVSTENCKPQTDNGVLRNPLLAAYPEADAGARELEAQQFAEKIIKIKDLWNVHDEGQIRPAQFSDIMVLVRRRTHLKIYEQALRRHSIPFLTSRRGGLLDTLEASDIQSLLGFLITPFADLALAHTLRTPIFLCSDDDLMMIQDSGAGSGESRANQLDPESRILSVAVVAEATGTARPAPCGWHHASSWWLRLRSLVENDTASPALQRAHRLLQRWILLADKLPVHDLLDRIYFEGDAKHRYAAAVPEVMCATVLANLQAFMEIALNVDAGRYPSLPGFLRELADLRRADDSESPDEGKISQAGNAIRIYTVHEAKGLEAPIVWLLDTNAKPPADRGYDALVDWPVAPATAAKSPVHFSLYGDKASRGQVREHYFQQEAALAQREDLNLLYVAMTRAKQALLVSGNGTKLDGMWYQRIADATDETVENPLLGEALVSGSAALAYEPAISIDVRLCQALPVGTRKTVMSDVQRHGIWLHGLLQYLATPDTAGGDGLMDELQRKLNIPSALMAQLWQQAQNVLSAPELARFFDEQYYLAASNELGYVNATGQLRRIDRLVEFDNEVWVLDYKTGANTGPDAHAAQLDEYRAAMQAIYPNKTVRCALIFTDGKLLEV
ncbi:MAG: UvrD-helicase domain-containing protein [Proteobacteria bacterium]|nr:UvrD-helicase domain-containing protein [Pseudomonadota bacterium]